MANASAMHLIDLLCIYALLYTKITEVNIDLHLFNLESTCRPT